MKLSTEPANSPGITDLAKARFCRVKPVKEEGRAVEIKNWRFRNRNREVCAPDRLFRPNSSNVRGLYYL
jgi:hypothetical protein